tara:strand:- start:174 stop:386 length:213 start_codon:yes stop_codon:yes gene_type:complete
MRLTLDKFEELRKGSVVTCVEVCDSQKDWFTLKKEYKIVASKVFGNYIRDDQGGKNQNVYGHSFFVETIK